MTKVIGLTGGIASGKSTVANFFREQNIPVIDADIIAKEVVEPGQHAYDKIIEAFGNTILQEDGTLDRKELGKLVFSDDMKRKKLNQIVHPEVKRRMVVERDTYLKAKEELIILDIPLLFENNLTVLVDKVVVVYVDPKTQLERLMKRNQLSEAEALSRIHSQMPIDEKRILADRVIDNSNTIEYTKKQCMELLKQF